MGIALTQVILYYIILYYIKLYIYIYYNITRGINFLPCPEVGSVLLRLLSWQNLNKRASQTKWDLQ